MGTIFGIRKQGDIMFNPAVSVKDDFELSLRMIASGFNAVCFNGFTCKAGHLTRGGGQDDRIRGENKKCYTALINRYPQLIKPSRREEEIRYVWDRGTEKEGAVWK